MSEDLQSLREEAMEDPVEFTLRFPRTLLERVTQRSKEVGGYQGSRSRYIRVLVAREMDKDFEVRFTDHFLDWWKYRGKGEPQQIVGAMARARAIGMTFPDKLRMVLKTFIDQGLL
jgi:hypothetical protein